MPVTTEIDTENAFDWAERTTNAYTLFGRDYEDITTTFDDGHIEVTNAQNGNILRFTLSDPTDALPIETQVITYAANGDVTSSNTLDDEGQRSIGSYENGVRVSEVLTDEAGLRPWSTIDITFEDGAVDSIDIDYEQTGDFTQDASFLTEISYDAQNDADWMFIIESRGGLSSTTTTIADHGGQTVASYTDGIITRLTQDDYGDVADWSEILSVFGDGVIETRFTFNDNGTSFTESFEDGLLWMTRLQDDNQTQPYRYIETFYDTEGNATRIETQNDTGGLIVEVLRETTVQVDSDNTAAWSQITTVTDGDGLLIARETQYDNGNLKLEDFADGQLVQRLNTQADGDTRLVTFENGQRSAVIKQDVSDAKNWTTQQFSYDANGVLATKATLLDNGDVILFAYEDGERSARLRVDGDDSNIWALQLTEFGPQGNVVTTYDTAQDLPEDYAYLLDSGSFSDFG